MIKKAITFWQKFQSKITTILITIFCTLIISAILKLPELYDRNIKNIIKDGFEEILKKQDILIDSMQRGYVPYSEYRQFKDKTDVQLSEIKKRLIIDSVNIRNLRVRGKIIEGSIAEKKEWKLINGKPVLTSN